MLIYEKNNKLNINFDNEINENPDIQIGKDGDKTEVLVDGNSNPAIPVPVLPEDVGKAIVVNEDGSYALAEAGGESNDFVVGFTIEADDETKRITAADKTLEEVLTAITAGKTVYGKYLNTAVNYIFRVCSYINNLPTHGKVVFVGASIDSLIKIQYQGDSSSQSILLAEAEIWH